MKNNQQKETKRDLDLNQRKEGVNWIWRIWKSWRIWSPIIRNKSKNFSKTFSTKTDCVLVKVYNKHVTRETNKKQKKG